MTACSLARVHVPGQPNPDEHQQLTLIPHAPQKVCTKCGERKPLAEFPIWRNNKDGRFPSCKICKAAHEREKRRTNPERARALATAQRAGRLERIREQQRAYRERNLEAYRERDRKRSQDPKRRAWAREYGRQAARRRRLGVDETSEAYSDIVINDPCSYCGAPAEHVDHIVPVYKGGTNGWDNLTAACASCNFRKGKGDLLRALLRRLV